MDITDIKADNYRTKLKEIKTTDETKLDEEIMKYVAQYIHGEQEYNIARLISLTRSFKLSELYDREKPIIRGYNNVKDLKKSYEKEILEFILHKKHNIKTCDEFIALMNKIIQKCNENNRIRKNNIQASGMSLLLEIPQESIDKLSSLKDFMEEKIESIKKKFMSTSDDLNNIKLKFQEYLSYYIDASERYKINPKYNIFPYGIDEAILILFICDFIYNYELIDLDNFIGEFASDYHVDTMVAGGKKSKKLPKKEILGNMRCIYKIPGDRKEYVKHKGKLITVKDYKELMKAKKPTKQTKPSKKAKKPTKQTKPSKKTKKK